MSFMETYNAVIRLSFSRRRSSRETTALKARTATGELSVTQERWVQGVVARTCDERVHLLDAVQGVQDLLRDAITREHQDASP